jgi:hypothetical protein
VGHDETLSVLAVCAEALGRLVDREGDRLARGEPARFEAPIDDLDRPVRVRLSAPARNGP